MEEPGNVRIIDIARLAGVSVGTVDRVLHKRGNVSEEKRTKVEAVLKEINYEPNLVARVLASKKTYSLAAIIPSFFLGDYWGMIYEGINKAIDELKKFNVALSFYYFDQYDPVTFAQQSEQLLGNDHDGVLIATHFEGLAIYLSDQLAKTGKPFIYIDSDIPGQRRLAYFGADSFVSGVILAKLMAENFRNDFDIITMYIKYKRSEVSIQMRQREQGFMKQLDQEGFAGKIHRIEFDPDDEQAAVDRLRQLLAATERPVGGIVFNSRIYEFARMLYNLEPELRQKCVLYGLDAIPKNVNGLKNDEVKVLLSQRPELQGYDSIKALGNYLLMKQTPDPVNYMPLDILIRDNIDYYKNYKL